jgi:hypothetical protein
VVAAVGAVPPVAAQAGHLPLLAAGDAGELVEVDFVQDHADPAQARPRHARPEDRYGLDPEAGPQRQDDLQRQLPRPGRPQPPQGVRPRPGRRTLAGGERDSQTAGAWVEPAAGNDRFGRWGERWYATTAALRPTTRHDYRALLDNQVLPAFAAARLADIDALAVREWLAGLVGGGLSAKRARKAHQVLALVLDAAVDGGRPATSPPG